MPIIPKRPNEVLVGSYDFQGDINDTESIVILLCSSDTTDKNGDAASVVDILSLSGTIIYYTVSGGTPDLSPYKCVLKAVTDEEHTYEHVIYVTVEE